MGFSGETWDARGDSIYSFLFCQTKHANFYAFLQEEFFWLFLGAVEFFFLQIYFQDASE